MDKPEPQTYLETLPTWICHYIFRLVHEAQMASSLEEINWLPDTYPYRWDTEDVLIDDYGYDHGLKHVQKAYKKLILRSTEN